jgi:hypothetical protein
MAEIIPLRASCRECAVSEPVSLAAWLRLRLLGLVQRRPSRVGNADDLPDRLRRDMGLTPRAQEPGRHYSDYLSSNRV